MAIQIKLKTKASDAIQEEPKKEVQRVIQLNARKTIDGDIFIKDHPELHIVISRKKNKILALPKSEMRDDIYHYQDDLFSFLADYGVIEDSGMEGGAILGSMEAKMRTPSPDSNIDPVQVAMSKLYDYFKLETPKFSLKQKFEDNEEERLMDPEVNTELGAVPHADKKGSIDPRFARRYYITYHF